jgi:hypothetical protein
MDKIHAKGLQSARTYCEVRWGPLLLMAPRAAQTGRKRLYETHYRSFEHSQRRIRRHLGAQIDAVPHIHTH